jgi:hypothetical protein
MRARHESSAARAAMRAQIGRGPFWPQGSPLAARATPAKSRLPASRAAAQPSRGRIQRGQRHAAAAAPRNGKAVRPAAEEVKAAARRPWKRPQMPRHSHPLHAASPSLWPGPPPALCSRRSARHPGAVFTPQQGSYNSEPMGNRLKTLRAALGSLQQCHYGAPGGAVRTRVILFLSPRGSGVWSCPPPMARIRDNETFHGKCVL